MTKQTPQEALIAWAESKGQDALRTLFEQMEYARVQRNLHPDLHDQLVAASVGFLAGCCTAAITDPVTGRRPQGETSMRRGYKHFSEVLRTAATEKQKKPT